MGVFFWRTCERIDVDIERKLFSVTSSDILLDTDSPPKIAAGIVGQYEIDEISPNFIITKPMGVVKRIITIDRHNKKVYLQETESDGRISRYQFK